MINRITLVGNLGKDPEFKEGSNWKMARFTVATSEGYKDKSGQWVNLTEWHNVNAWGNFADFAKNLNKGDKVFIEGKIKTTEREGKYYTSIEVSGYNAQLEKVTKVEKSESVKKYDVLKSDSWNDRAEENKGDDWGVDLPF